MRRSFPVAPPPTGVAFNGIQSWIGKDAMQLRDLTAKRFTQAQLSDDQLVSMESATPRKGGGGFGGGGGAAAAAAAAAPGKHAAPPAPAAAGRKPPTKRKSPWEEPKEEPGAPAPLVPADGAAANAAPGGGAAGGGEGNGEQILITFRKCGELLKPILKHPKAADFLQPVDWQRYGLTDYPKVITQPMDLGTIQKRLETRSYPDASAFVRDVRLVWSNAVRHVPLPYATRSRGLYTPGS